MDAAFLLAQQAATQSMIALTWVDMAIIILYFVLVLGIGFYLKRFAETGEDFFLAGRGMTVINCSPGSALSRSGPPIPRRSSQRSPAARSSSAC